jgi:hypothetical protein
MTAAAIAPATDRLDNASRDSEQCEHERKEPTDLHDHLPFVVGAPQKATNQVQ